MRRFWVGLGSQIRDGRVAHGWSVADLASRSGVSRRSVYAIESGMGASFPMAIRLASALGLRLDASLVDARRKRHEAQGFADPVHSLMGEVEAQRLRLPGFGVSLDEPYQHYQFAGRADFVAWDLEVRALLHIENRTRFPDFQEMAGSFNAKRAYLGKALAERPGIGRWASETHVVAALWSSEVIHAIRIRPESFRSLCPDEPIVFNEWWMGRPPREGSATTLILLDPLATARQRPWIDLDEVLAGVRSGHRGYRDVVSKLDLEPD